MTPSTSTSKYAARPPTLSNDTLRERILTGGGTTANVRGSLTKVAGRYAHFVHSLSLLGHDESDNNETPSPPVTTAAALQTELLLHDLEMRKLILSSKADELNSALYSATLSEMQNTLEDTRRDTESLSETLANERQMKQYREEYNALAKMGNESHPPIRVTWLELQRVQKETEGVEEELKKARMELRLRERQMRLFMASLGDLKSTLREEGLRNTQGDISSNFLASPLMKGEKRNHSARTDYSNNDIGAL